MSNRQPGNRSWQWLPPCCFLLALALLVAGFAVWSIDAPQANVDLHRARIQGDERFEAALEGRLASRQWSRTVLLAGLFGGSVIMAMLAFLVMRGDR